MIETFGRVTSPLGFLALAITAIGLVVLAPADAQAKRDVKITYVSQESVYVAAGRSAGLSIGDTLRVMRGKKKVGSVVVTSISTRSAACSVIKGNIKAGDVISVSGASVPKKSVIKRPLARKRSAVWHTILPGESLSSIARRYNTTVKRLMRENEIENASLIQAGHRLRVGRAVGNRGGRSNSNRRVRGMITLQSFFRKDFTSNGPTRIQPGIGARVRVLNVAGTGAEFRMRHRSRLYYRSGPQLGSVSNHEWSHRVYEFSLVYDNASAETNWGFGRVLPAPVRGMGYIDGAYFSRRLNERVTVGGAAGSVPDSRTSDVNLRRKKFGGFVTYERALAQSLLMTASGALSTEFDGAETSRDFLFFQGSLVNNGFYSLYQSVEIDINRGWRHQQSGSRFTFTNYNANANVSFGRFASIYFSYDARRNILTADNHQFASSLMDLSTHRGIRGGVRLRFSNRISLRGRTGIRFRADQTANNRFSAVGLTINRFPSRRKSVSLDVTFIDAQFAKSIRPTLRYRFTTRRGLSMSLTGAAYFQTFQSQKTQNYYIDASMSSSLSERLFLTGSYRQYLDKELMSLELFGELGFRL